MNNKYGIPILKVEADTLPEAWEKAVLATWENGMDIKTEYASKMLWNGEAYSSTKT